MTRRITIAVALLAVTTLYRPALAQDPSGFTEALNAARAQQGLPLVAYDGNLAGWAESNNGQQVARGLGHFVSCGTGQCSAVAWDAGTALVMWSQSPAHAAILFNPGATSCGFSCGGGFATANVGGGYAVQPGYQVQYAAPAMMHPRRRGLFGRCR